MAMTGGLSVLTSNLCCLAPRLCAAAAAADAQLRGRPKVGCHGACVLQVVRALLLLLLPWWCPAGAA